MTFRAHRLALCAAAVAAFSSAAAAETILIFGGDGASSVVAANPTPSTTTITATDVLVSITSLLGSPYTLPMPAYFDLSLHNTSAAGSLFHSVGQTFAGSFSFTSDQGGAGTNYLSGSFSDLVSGGGSGLSLSASDAVAGESVVFTSDIVPSTYLNLPRSVNLSFADVAPTVRLVGTAPTQTISAFSSSIAGDFSGSYGQGVGTPLPEPASVLLLGSVMLGVGMARARRSPG